MSYFCELESLLFEAFEDKDDDMLSYHYKLRNTTAFETTSSLLPTSEYGFYKKNNQNLYEVKKGPRCRSVDR